MGNLKSSLSAIAAENCAQTFSFSFGNGRQFPATTVGPLAIQPRVNTNLLTAAFNDDLTDCVEVFTPFSAFSHLGNGQGLFRSAKTLQPYVQEGLELNPIMVKAILEGLQEFQDKISEECLASERNETKQCLESKRLENGQNEEFQKYVEKALEKINFQTENQFVLQPSF